MSNELPKKPPKKLSKKLPQILSLFRPKKAGKKLSPKTYLGFIHVYPQQTVYEAQEADRETAQDFTRVLPQEVAKKLYSKLLY